MSDLLEQIMAKTISAQDPFAQTVRNTQNRDDLAINIASLLKADTHFRGELNRQGLEAGQIRQSVGRGGNSLGVATLLINHSDRHPDTTSISVEQRYAIGSKTGQTHYSLTFSARLGKDLLSQEDTAKTITDALKSILKGFSGVGSSHDWKVFERNLSANRAATVKVNLPVEQDIANALAAQKQQVDVKNSKAQGTLAGVVDELTRRS